MKRSLSILAVPVSLAGASPVAAGVACGSSSPSSPSSDVTITITSSGVSPVEGHIGVGGHVVKRTCGFHDHTNENDPIFKGGIVIE
jgi:hypothetical protein